jgi:hypothetical protein
MGMARRKSHTRTALLSFGVFGVSILLSLGLSEVILRGFFPQNTEPHPPGLYQLDSELGFVLTPGASGTLHDLEWVIDVHVNSMGLRERELGKKQRGETRLLVLGDSFTYGVGVNAKDAWPKQVEKRMKKDGRHWLTVINAGVPQYGTHQEAVWFERIANLVQPDAVLLGVFLGNDFLDNLKQTRYQIVSGYLVSKSYDENWISLTERLGIPPELKIALRTRSHLYALLMNAWMELGVRVGWTNTETMLDIYRETETDQTKQAIIAMRQSIRLLKRACQERRTPVGIVLIPDGRVTGILNGREGFRLSMPADLFRMIASQEHLPVLDLGKQFQEDSSLYFPVDGHWNIAGHELAGAVIAFSLLHGELKSILQPTTE